MLACNVHFYLIEVSYTFGSFCLLCSVFKGLKYCVNNSYILSVIRMFVNSFLNFFIKLWIKFAWRRPALTKGNPSLQSALRSLTSVFGMGTGVSFLLSPPHYLIIWVSVAHSKLDLKKIVVPYQVFILPFWLSPRSISISPLRTSLHFHSWPIYLIISQGSYFLKEMGNLILRWASHLDAFSVYPFPT